MREYVLHDVFADITVKVQQDNDCIFCDHCTDIFWDYSHGIYAMICDLNQPEINNNAENHTCILFKESE